MTTLLQVTLGLLLLSQVLLLAEGGCYFTPPVPGATHCRTRTGQVVQPRRTIMDGCYRCTCRANGGFDCCGTGRYAGTIGAPLHCRVIPKGKCGFKIVMRNDNTLPCA